LKRVLLIYWFIPLLSMAQSDSLFEKHVFDSLPYRLLRPHNPEPGKKYPLVIFLHGSGERGTDNELNLKYVTPLFLDSIHRIKYPSYILIPQCPISDRWVNTQWNSSEHVMAKSPTASLARVMSLVDYSVREWAVDAQRIYVGGLSMGGFGTWELLARQPNKFAAAIPICGGGDVSTAKRIRKVPVWVFHGALDAVVPPERSRKMVMALKKAKGKPRYTEYPLAQHDSWTPALAEPELLKWLFSQRLK
jgi:predicted peptidase